jgi:hypothetical protein
MSECFVIFGTVIDRRVILAQFVFNVLLFSESQYEELKTYLKPPNMVSLLFPQCEKRRESCAFLRQALKESLKAVGDRGIKVAFGILASYKSASLLTSC